MNKEEKEGIFDFIGWALFLLIGPLVGAVFGSIGGWIVDLTRIGGWIRLVVNRSDITMVELGATVGFITSFLKLKNRGR